MAAKAKQPEPEEEAGAGENEEGAAQPKRKLPLKLIIIAAASLTVLGGGGTAAFFMLGSSKDAAHDGRLPNVSARAAAERSRRLGRTLSAQGGVDAAGERGDRAEPHQRCAVQRNRRAVRAGARGGQGTNRPGHACRRM